MAACASGSLQVLLGALHTHLLECKVCMERFSSCADEEPDRRPLALGCGHVLCAECVCVCVCVCVRARARVCKPCLFGCASSCKHGAGVCGSCAVAPQPSQYQVNWSIKRGIGVYDLRENQPQSGGRSPGVNVCDICSQISAYHWV